MDDGVGAHAETNLNNNFNVLPKVKTDRNGNLTDSPDSLYISKSRTSSIGSEYEVVSDEAVECSENECIGEIEGKHDQNQNNEIKELDFSSSVKNSQVDDQSDASSAMDEEFVIVDDDGIEETEVSANSDGNLVSRNSDENLSVTNNDENMEINNDDENRTGTNENMAGTNNDGNLASASNDGNLAGASNDENLVSVCIDENLASANNENLASASNDENLSSACYNENQTNANNDRNLVSTGNDETQTNANNDENKPSTTITKELLSDNFEMEKNKPSTTITKELLTDADFEIDEIKLSTSSEKIQTNANNDDENKPSTTSTKELLSDEDFEMDENERSTSNDETQINTNNDDENKPSTSISKELLSDDDFKMDENKPITSNDETRTNTNDDDEHKPSTTITKDLLSDKSFEMDENKQSTSNDENKPNTTITTELLLDDVYEIDENKSSTTITTKLLLDDGFEIDENKPSTSSDENKPNTTIATELLLDDVYEIDENKSSTTITTKLLLDDGFEIDENKPSTSNNEIQTSANNDEIKPCTTITKELLLDDDFEMDQNEPNTGNDETQTNANDDENKPSTIIMKELLSDDFEMNENKPSTTVTKELLSDDDFEMDEIIAEFAEEEKKKNSVVKLSDSEDEIDSLLDEFVETQTISKADANLILSSDDEDEMECLLEEFSKENLSDDESSSQNINHRNSITPMSEKNVYDSATTVCNVSSAASGGSIELTVTSSKISNSCVDENDCVIVCDDDNSDCSSVEIIIEDDIADEENDAVATNQDTEKGSVTGFTSEEPATFSEQKLNFEDMVIVDEVQDTSDTDIRKFITESELFRPVSPGNSPFHLRSEIGTSNVEPNDSASACDSVSGLTSNINIYTVASTDPANPGSSTLHTIASNITVSSVKTSDPATSSVETSNRVSPNTSNLDVESKMDISSVKPSDPANLGNTTSHKTSEMDNYSAEPCDNLGESTLQITSKMDVSSVEPCDNLVNSTLQIASKVGISSESIDPVSPDNRTSKRDISNDELNESKSNENLTVQTHSNCPPNNQKDSAEASNAENIDNELKSNITELNCLANNLSAVSEEISKPLDVANFLRASDGATNLSGSSPSKLNDETDLKSLEVQTDTENQMEIATEPNEAVVVKDKAGNVQISDSVAEINPDDAEKNHLADAIPSDVTGICSITVEKNTSNEVSSNSTQSSDANSKTEDVQKFEQLMEQNVPINDENWKNIDKKSNSDVREPKEQPEEEKQLVSNNEGEDEIVIDIDEETEKLANEDSSVPKTASESSIPDSGQPIATSSSELHPVSDEVKKRKLEDVDDETNAKKQKHENTSSNLFNGDESSASDASSDFALRNTKMEDLVSDVSVADCKVIEKANQFLPLDSSMKIRASKKVFEQISLYICDQVAKECFKKPLENAQKEKAELKRKIETLSKSLESFRSQANDFHNSQKKSFAEYSFKPKAHTRTVGVNVKIYRLYTDAMDCFQSKLQESEIKQAISMQQNNATSKPLNIGEHLTYKQETKPQPTIPKTEAVSVKPEIKPFVTTTANVIPTTNVKESVITNITPSAPPPPFQNTSVYVPRTQIKEYVLSSVASSHLVRRQLLPRIIAQSTRPVLGPQAVVGLTNRLPTPTMTMSGNRMMSVPNPQRPGVPNTRSVVLVPTTTVTSQARSNQYMTTIDLTKDERKMNPALVPIRDYLHLLPPGARSAAVSMQSSQMPRPTLAPPLPTSLLGTRTVTYIVPANSTVGGRGGIPSFLPQPNQPMQLVFRMTSAGGMPTLGTVVNSVSRMPGGGHHVFNPSAPRMSAIQTINSSQPRMMGISQQPPSYNSTVARLAGTSPPSFSNPAPRMVGTPHPSFGTPAQRMTGMPQQLANAPPRSSSGLILFSHTSKSQSAGINNRALTGGNKDTQFIPRRHPAPFPKSPEYPDNKMKSLPPKPSLKGNKNPSGGIVLSWNMYLEKHHAPIQSYQLFAYQETDGPVDASLWKKVGDVNALPLPMACTLTQFIDKNRYFFTVRAVDVYSRAGPYSDPVSILYAKEVDPGVKK